MHQKRQRLQTKFVLHFYFYNVYPAMHYEELTKDKVRETFEVFI